MSTSIEQFDTPRTVYTAELAWEQARAYVQEAEVAIRTDRAGQVQIRADHLIILCSTFLKLEPKDLDT